MLDFLPRSLGLFEATSTRGSLQVSWDCVQVLQDVVSFSLDLMNISEKAWRGII